jgi:uncharacterized protein (DUF58 family)
MSVARSEAPPADPPRGDEGGGPPPAPDVRPPSPRKPRSTFRVNARGWIYLVLTVSVAFAAGFKGNNLLFAIFSVLFGLFVVSGLLTVLVARRMEVSRALPEAVPAGDLFAVAVRFRNAKRLWPAFCLKFEDRLTHDGRPALLQPTPVWLPLAKPGMRVRGTYYLSAHERGWARLGPFTVTSEFTPGLFTYRKVIPVEDTFLVYPRMGVLNRRLVNTLFARVPFSELVASTFLPGDEEFASLREYRPGDSPRRIHWKMSARLQDRLLVREFEDAKVRDAVILLETFLPNPGDPRRRARLERAVSFAATLADALLAESYQVKFKAFAPEPVSLALEPRRGAIDDLLYVLATLKATRVHMMGDLLRQEDGGRNEVYFLLRIGEEPLPAWDFRSRSIVIDASDMRNLMYTPA